MDLRGEAMALVKCDECGKEISKTAKVCPGCGSKEPTAAVRAHRKEVDGAQKVAIVVAIPTIIFVAWLLITLVKEWIDAH